MLYHVLSVLDAIVAIIMVAGHFELVRIPLLYAAIYLAGKLFFWRDFFSIVDAAIGVYLFFFVFFGHASVLTWVFLVWFLYKISIWLFSSMSH